MSPLVRRSAHPSVRATLLAVLLAAALAGCGKKGAPVAPGPASAITYPKSYPAP